MNLSEYVKKYRQQHDLSMREFATLANVSPQTISNIERGTNNNGTLMQPTVSMLSKIAKATGVSTTELCGIINDDVTINPQTENVEPELIPYLEKLRSNSKMRILFDAAADATPEQLDAIVNMVEMFKR